MREIDLYLGELKNFISHREVNYSSLEIPWRVLQERYDRIKPNYRGCECSLWAFILRNHLETEREIPPEILHFESVYVGERLWHVWLKAWDGVVDRKEATQVYRWIYSLGTRDPEHEENYLLFKEIGLLK